jgi:predicted nucleotidyltransferase
VARGEENAGSDVDIAVHFAPHARPSLIKLIRIEQRIAGWLQRPVDLVKEPACKPELQEHIERDAIRAF